MRCRKRERRDRALSEFALDLELTAHQLAKAFRNGQAKTGPVKTPRMTVIDLMEGSEDATKILLRNSDSGIAH